MKLSKCVFSIIVLLNIFFGHSYCTKKKEQEFKDDKWRDESLRIASDICNKFRSCSDKILYGLKPTLKNHFLSEIRADRCTEKNKKSRVYLLKGYSPELIQTHTRKCADAIRNAECKDLETTGIKVSEDCVIMEKIQKGEAL